MALTFQRYVWHGSAQDDSDSTWNSATIAYLTIELALAAAAAGDNIAIAMDHQQTQAATETLTGAGTKSNPVKVISLDRSDDSYATMKSSTGYIRVTGSTSDIVVSGDIIFYGVNLEVSDNLQLQSGTTDYLFNDSHIKLTGTSSAVIFGNTAHTTGVVWRNVDLEYAGANNRIDAFRSSFDWKGGSLTFSGVGSSASAFLTTSTEGGNAWLRDLDLSALTFGNEICSGTDDRSLVVLERCKIGTTVAVQTAISSVNYKVIISSCTTSADTYIEHEEYRREGNIVDDTATYLDASYDGGTSKYSMKMTSNGTYCEEAFVPLESPPIVGWTDSIVSRTFTIEILHDNATDLQDDEIWMELEYAQSGPQGAIGSDRNATLQTTPTDQEAGVGTGSWTISPAMSNANSQKLSVTVIPDRKGPITARIYLAKPSYTVFYNPVITES
jgi:hypothetical protein